MKIEFSIPNIPKPSHETLITLMKYILTASLFFLIGTWIKTEIPSLLPIVSPPPITADGRMLLAGSLEDYHTKRDSNVPQEDAVESFILNAGSLFKVEERDILNTPLQTCPTEIIRDDSAPPGVENKMEQEEPKTQSPPRVIRRKLFRRMSG